MRFLKKWNGFGVLKRVSRFSPTGFVIMTTGFQCIFMIVIASYKTTILKASIMIIENELILWSWSLNMANFLLVPLFSLFPIIAIVGRVWKSGPTLKGHNFLILSPIFVIHISLESSLSLISNRTSVIPKSLIKLSYNQQTKQGSGDLKPEKFSTSKGNSFFILFSFQTIYMSLESCRCIVSYGKSFIAIW